MDDAARVSVTSAVADMPSAGEVEALYVRSSRLPPLSEPPSVGAAYARLYEHALDGSAPLVALARSAEDGALCGLAYAHPWSWEAVSDPWSAELKRRLGKEHVLLEGAFALPLLAVDPLFGGRGWGTRLLRALVSAVPVDRIWLQTTDVDSSPAGRLYAREGWRFVGHGPDAPNGKPGLVLTFDKPGPG